MPRTVFPRRGRPCHPVLPRAVWPSTGRGGQASVRLRQQVGVFSTGGRQLRHWGAMPMSSGLGGGPDRPTRQAFWPRYTQWRRQLRRRPQRLVVFARVARFARGGRPARVLGLCGGDQEAHRRRYESLDRQHFSKSNGGEQPALRLGGRGKDTATARWSRAAQDT